MEGGMQVEIIRVGDKEMKLMRREQWNACEPNHGELDEFGDDPAGYIIVGQCYTTSECTDKAACCANMRAMQRYHMEDRNFADVAFNYVVANDGIVYEGRGYKWRPATARGWNAVALGVAFMGEYKEDSDHCKQAIDAAFVLFEYLCNEGRLDPNYIVYALRQVRPLLERPMPNLFEKIKSWDKWRPYGDETEQQQATPEKEPANE